MTEVVVTGLGAMSCLGAGIPALWQGLLAGGGMPQRIADPLAHMRSPVMYLVDEQNFPPEPAALGHVPLGAGPRLGVAAAREALADAGLDEGTCRAMSVVMGVELGNASMHEARRVAGSPAEGPWTPMTVTASAIGAAVGAMGSNVSVGNACAASGYAVAIAADMIRAGEAEVVLAGGAETGVRVALGAFNRLGAMDPQRCRPFDARRQGTLFGNGAALLVLESAEHAARRPVMPYARIAGSGWSCDGYHATAPEPEGQQIIRAMTQALAEAELEPDAVGAVIPHGTGTPLNDVVESRALRRVFGDRCADLPLLSLKSMIGHTGGVAGAFACLTAALMIRAGRVPASPRLEEQDPACQVWLPHDSPVPLTSPSVLVNAYAFGGNNVSLVLEGTR